LGIFARVTLNSHYLIAKHLTAGSQYPSQCPSFGDCAYGSTYPIAPARGVIYPIIFIAGLFLFYHLLNKVVFRQQLVYADALNQRVLEYNLVNALLRNITGYTYDVFAFKGLLPKDTRVTLGYQDLGLTLPDGTVVLQGVTGEFKNTTLNAIMGPSGSGKSVRIHVLVHS
jgi:ABC-type multidrug transport system fused ATPase/permease subunit